MPGLDGGPRPGVLTVADIEGRLSGLAEDAGKDAASAKLLMATALLYHDHHDPAHDLVQDRSDADACLIHAILHRREPDYWNAKYWFRRAGDHTVYRALTPAVLTWHEDGGSPLLRRITLTGTVDPVAMVEECERVAPEAVSHPDAVVLRRIQQAEFEALAAHLLA